ncbi:MAG: NAD(P)-dependent oxidoreductase [Bryobacteraceae bacterium]|nr:NAD(P)-dependent oxidoreductase [Bryobacteraceae bacterium]
MRILITESENFSSKALELLRQAGEVVAADLDRSGLESAVAGAEVLWVRLRHRIDRQLLDRAPELKVVVSPTTGLNHIDTEELSRRGIALLSLRGETAFLRNVRATAELTVGLMLGLLRHLPEAAAHARGGGWTRDLFRGGELYEKTVGIVGYGRLGRLVARYLLAFDCRVLAADPNVEADAVEPGVALVELDRLLAASGIVSLHVNLTDQTAGFFGARQFEAMQPGALFINTARGELVDERALLAALETGRLAGVALDVLTGESSTGMSGHPLVRYANQNNNMILTPHIGGCTLESMSKTEEFLAGRLAQHLTSRLSAAVTV